MKLKCQDKDLSKPLRQSMKQSKVSENNLTNLFKELRKHVRVGSIPQSDASTFINYMRSRSLNKLSESADDKTTLLYKYA